MNQTILYFKIYKNKIVVKNINNGVYTVIDDCIFSNNRYLIGEITIAIEALKEKRKEILKDNVLNYIFAPLVLIQPINLIEDTLSEVEKILLIELVHGAGFSRNANVWSGAELNDEKVVEKLEEFTGKSFRLK